MSANEQTQNTQMSSSSAQSSTNLRLSQEASNRQNRMIDYDGRITAKQEVFQIRQNQPSK